MRIDSSRAESVNGTPDAFLASATSFIRAKRSRRSASNWSSILSILLRILHKSFIINDL